MTLVRIEQFKDWPATPVQRIAVEPRRETPWDTTSRNPVLPQTPKELIDRNENPPSFSEPRLKNNIYVIAMGVTIGNGYRRNNP